MRGRFRAPRLNFNTWLTAQLRRKNSLRSDITGTGISYPSYLISFRESGRVLRLKSYATGPDLAQSSTQAKQQEIVTLRIGTLLLSKTTWNCLKSRARPIPIWRPSFRSRETPFLLINYPRFSKGEITRIRIFLNNSSRPRKQILH